MGWAEYLQKLPERRKTKTSVWMCSECGYRNSDLISQTCQNCGRTPSGDSGTRPNASDRRRI